MAGNYVYTVCQKSWRIDYEPWQIWSKPGSDGIASEARVRLNHDPKAILPDVQNSQTERVSKCTEFLMVRFFFADFREPVVLYRFLMIR